MVIKVLSLILMVVLLIIVMVKKKSDSIKGEHNAEVGDNSINREKAILTNDSVLRISNESKETIDFKLIHDEVYHVEYKLVPQLVDSYEEHPDKTTQIITTIYENLYILQNRLRRIAPYYFGSISCEVFGDMADECLAVYDYPKPLDVPLAKYAAVYFSKKRHEYNYWTFEFSEAGKYFLCSTIAGQRNNYGSRPEMSKDEFIHEVGQLMNVDEALFQQKNELSRRYMLELNDSSFKEVIGECPLLVVCFYDYNQPSQSLISVLEQLAQAYTGRISIGVFDVYGGVENSSSPVDYSVHALPTLLFFAGGRVVDKSIGMCSSDVLRAMFDKLLKHN